MYRLYPKIAVTLCNYYYLIKSKQWHYLLLLFFNFLPPKDSGNRQRNLKRDKRVFCFKGIAIVNFYWTFIHFTIAHLRSPLWQYPLLLLLLLYVKYLLKKIEFTYNERDRLNYWQCWLKRNRTIQKTKNWKSPEKKRKSFCWIYSHTFYW